MDFPACPGSPDDTETVWTAIGPARYTEFSYPAATSDDTAATGTTGGDVVLNGYLQSFLFFEDDARDEVLSSFRFRDDVQEEADAFLLPYVEAGTVTVGVHIRGGDRDECTACVIATDNFFEKSMDFMLRRINMDDGVDVYDDDEREKKSVTFVVATDSKRDRVGAMNRTDVIFTEKEDPFVDMAILAGCQHMIITVGTYGWWAAWLGPHQREGGMVIYQGDNLHWEWISDITRPEEMYPPTWIPVNETN